jgi:hypothetical protein
MVLQLKEEVSEARCRGIGMRECDTILLKLQERFANAIYRQKKNVSGTII